MGKLVKFEPREQPSIGPAKPSATGKILLFTGVRYERGTTWPLTEQRDPSRPKRRRG